MTTQEEQQVRAMRAAGIDAAQIAEVLGLPIADVRGVFAAKATIPATPAPKARRPPPMHPSCAGLDKARKALAVGPGGIHTWQDKLRADGVLPARPRRGYGL